MSILYLWLPEDAGATTGDVVTRMERALRAQPEQKASTWSVDGLALGVLEASPCGLASVAPVRRGDRYAFWIVGEVYDGGALVDARGVASCRMPKFRERLLERLLADGFGELASLDGEYLLVLWDAQARELTLANDRFGGLPLYWTRSPSGTAIAGGVRGVLAAPGGSAEPDEEALREAVTFGGFRLGGRTNVRGVEMLPGGVVVTVRDGTLRSQRYWSYRDIPSREPRPTEELIEQAAALWQRAIRIRTDDCERPGQTLSGGLDSRAILAEAAPRAKHWAAVTYGVPGCDDARFAARAARAAGVSWRFHDLYPPGVDWLDSRTQRIQETDGLIALGDLMHVDTVAVQSQEMHVHFSGYIGDVVCGSTYADIEEPSDLFAQLPYYGTGLGLSGDASYERILHMIGELGGASPRFVIFEHKFPQSTNRWTAAWRPWLLVRKPFLDYELFDFWQGLPLSIRVEGRLYEHFLRARYPRLFATIPNHKTGVPVLTPGWRYQAHRVARFGYRKLRRSLRLSAPSRAYHDDRGHLGRNGRARLEKTLLGKGGLCCEILGREAVERVLRGWLERGAAPEQVISAMYVFETYHAGLAEHLRTAGTAAGSTEAS